VKIGVIVESAVNNCYSQLIIRLIN